MGRGIDSQQSAGFRQIFVAIFLGCAVCLTLLSCTARVGGSVGDFSKGKNINIQDDTAFRTYIRNGDTEAVEMFLRRGKNPDLRDEFAATPLMEAAAKGNIEIVRALLAAGANINARDSYGFTALQLASANERDEVVHELVKGGADINLTDRKSSTALLRSIHDPDIQIAEMLGVSGVKTITINDYVQLRKRSDYLRLGKESVRRQTIIVRELLQRGAGVNVMDDENLISPLGLAVLYGHTEIAELLIVAGADPNPEKQKFPPLANAAAGGNLPLVKLLLDNGANVNIVTQQQIFPGFTPLMYASKNGHLDTVKLLVERGADITRHTPTGKTALSLGRQNGHKSIEKFLMQKEIAKEHKSGPK